MVVGTNRLKRFFRNINFKCPILAQVAAYPLKGPGEQEVSTLKPFLELSLCSFSLLLFFGEVRLYREKRQNSLGSLIGVISNKFNIIGFTKL